MNLKKINANLQKALIEKNLLEPFDWQQETYSTIKSGADVIIQTGRKTGKSTTIALHAIQKMQQAQGESTRALIICENKEKVLEMVTLLKELAHYTDLRIFGVHEKGDIDYDKNIISLGLDILVGTPTKINDLFASAGFNINTLKFFAIDNADEIFKIRQDTIILRLASSIEKTQYLFFCNQITDRVEALADKIMVEPLFFEEE
jgi:ATP-dependent RNA helicase RhlE